MENKFIRLADLPPNPMDKAALKQYQEMGFHICLLTEDNVFLVKDETVSPEYKQAIQNISDMGMQVWIRNMFNDPDYFDSNGKTDGSNYGCAYELEARHITDEFSAFPVPSLPIARESWLSGTMTRQLLPSSRRVAE